MATSGLFSLYLSPVCWRQMDDSGGNIGPAPFGCRNGHWAHSAVTLVWVILTALPASGFPDLPTLVEWGSDLVSCSVLKTFLDQIFHSWLKRANDFHPCCHKTQKGFTSWILFFIQCKCLLEDSSACPRRLFSYNVICFWSTWLKLL